MFQSSRPHLPHMTERSLAEQVFRTWRLPMARLDWKKRLDLLVEIDRLLRESHPPALARTVSRDLTARLVEGMGGDTIGSVEQAWIYLNSSDETHRRLAGLWLAEKG